MEGRPHIWFHTTPRMLLGKNIHRILRAPKVEEASSSPQFSSSLWILDSIAKDHKFSPWGIIWGYYKEPSSFLCIQYLPPQAEKIFRIFTRSKPWWPYSVLPAENWKESRPEVLYLGHLEVVFSSEWAEQQRADSFPPHPQQGTGAAGDKGRLLQINRGSPTISQLPLPTNKEESVRNVLLVS